MHQFLEQALDLCTSEPLGVFVKNVDFFWTPFSLLVTQPLIPPVLFDRLDIDPKKVLKGEIPES